MNLHVGALVRNTRNTRRAVVVFCNDRTVILRFARGRTWTTDRRIVERNYRIV